VTATGTVIIPPVCELQHNCTVRQAHALLTAYCWIGVALAVVVAVCAVVKFVDWRRKDRW
jgi:hypothetical protein